MIINCECLAESMLHDFGPINVHGAPYLKTFNVSGIKCDFVKAK